MRCIKPLAPSRNETNSSRVNVGADKTWAIRRICAYGWPVQASHPATIKLTHYLVRLESPIALQKGELPNSNVELYEVKTHTRFVGASQGLSFRVVRGVYYRVGAGGEQPVNSQSVDKQDDGALAITNQNVYFVGPLKSMRISLRKLVTVQGYSDGISLTSESANPKPIIFKLDDPWFAGNLILKLALLRDGGSASGRPPDGPPPLPSSA
jgi:hypothetical protein